MRKVSPKIAPFHYELNTMKIVTPFIFMTIFLNSCILVIDKKPAGGNLTSTDSSKAFGIKQDTVKTPLPSDSQTLNQSFAYHIDTRNVHPQQLIEFSKTLIGIPYKYGSTNPEVGFDCSGFITYTFGHFGILVPRSSIDFTKAGKEISIENSKGGDLILFTGTDSTERFVGHIGLIISNDNNQVSFIHSTSGKQYGVTITPFNDYYKSRYLKTVRVFRENDSF